jgi:transcriptional regulator GlxA family with amidase domain
MDRRVEFAVNVMRNELAEQLSVIELSKRASLSPSRLRELFKKEIGESPSQFLRELRVQRAEHLLKTTFLSVKEIAFVTGAKNVSGFVRRFRGRHGVTPGVFRAQWQGAMTEQLKGEPNGD